MANKTLANPRPTITPIAGQRVLSRLVNGVQSIGVMLTARAEVDVSVAPATALRNRGSVWALFDEVGIDENGRDTHVYDGRMLRFLSEMHAPSALTATRAAVGVATYFLEESAMIWFAHPLAAAPNETTYKEADARQLLEVFARQVTAPNAALFDVGPATVAITNVSITVQHIYDPRTRALPLFIPRARQIVEAVPSASTEQPVFIKATNPIRALAVQQFSSAGEQNDIITALTLRSDNRDIIGPSQMPLDEISLLGEYEFGGLVFSNQAHLGWNFQRSGRVSNVINPADEVNLRFEFNAAPSATGADSRIRIQVIELESVQGLTVPPDQIPFLI